MCGALQPCGCSPLERGRFGSGSRGLCGGCPGQPGEREDRRAHSPEIFRPRRAWGQGRWNRRGTAGPSVWHAGSIAWHARPSRSPAGGPSFAATGMATQSLRSLPGRFAAARRAGELRPVRMSSGHRRRTRARAPIAFGSGVDPKPDCHGAVRGAMQGRSRTLRMRSGWRAGDTHLAQNERSPEGPQSPGHAIIKCTRAGRRRA